MATTSTIFDKTEKGREEIATRKFHLTPRLRTLLVMIDGKHDSNELTKKLAAVGIDEQSINELFAAGFIAPAGGATSSAAQHAPDSPPAVESAPAAIAQTPALSPLPPGENQFQAIYHFYNETIKSTIGLRGYGLQLKVERAGSIDDFRALRQAYLEAVLKAKGSEMARSLGDRLDQLLNFKEMPAGGASGASPSAPAAVS